MKVKLYYVAAAVLVTVGLSGGVALAQSDVSPCGNREEMHLLDFWVGNWNVYSGDQIIGTNRIEKVLSGCAILEHWKSAGGGEGKSLFYYYPAEERWKQVWVTENSFQRGGVKEKSHVEMPDNGVIRFQGTIVTAGGNEYLDRTTLIPFDVEEVEQVIEISVDGGESWKEMFRGVYRRAR